MDQSEARQDAILQNCRKFLNKNQRENKSEFQLLPENVAVTSEGPSGSKGFWNINVPLRRSIIQLDFDRCKNWLEEKDSAGPKTLACGNNLPVDNNEICVTIDDLFQGKIEQIESELVDYFLDSPDGVWVGSVPNNFDRLLLHTVAQYLSLRSLSNLWSINSFEFVRNETWSFRYRRWKWWKKRNPSGQP